MAKIIKISGSDGEVLDGEVFVEDTQSAELYQPAGFHHIPEEDATGILLYVGTDESHGVVICPKRRKAVTNSPGETVLYSMSGGTIKAKITLDSSGNAILDGDGVNKLGGTATEAIIKGNAYTSSENIFLVGLHNVLLAIREYADTIKTTVDSSPYPITTKLTSAIDAFTTGSPKTPPSVPVAGILFTFLQALITSLSSKTFTE